MYRDVSEIQNNICAIITDDKTIISYNGSDNITYRLISNKYYPTYQEPSSPPNANNVCYTIQELETLPSTYDFITPIYYSMAITTALILFFVAFRLIIYPFFRNKL